jgi:hypothetical protein
MTEPDPITELVILIRLETTNIERHQNAVASSSINRAQLIKELNRLGVTPTEIGRAVGLSRSRVHQIINPHGKDNP